MCTKVAARSFAFIAVLVASRGGAAADPPACAPVPLFEGGRAARPVCVAQAGPGVTVLDLGDAWAPAIFSDTAERPQSYRETFVALANERLGAGRRWETARRDRYFELYGIFPSFSVIGARLRDETRHACHAAVDDDPLRAIARPIAPWTVAAPAPGRRASVVNAIAVAQRHLRCEGLLSARADAGAFDAATQEALRVYQRRHMLPSPGVLDADTREALLTNSRELDFRALLRALRERVADAAGLIEDGSASHRWEPVLGRFLESAEYRRPMRSEPLANGAPDLVDPATEAAARALGWTSPEVAARALAAAPPQLLAIRLPPPPAYHRPAMKLRAEVDRGDVWRSYPVDAEGRPRPSPVKHRPTFTLFAETAGGEIALVRWPTTIGGWKAEADADDGSEHLEYKESPVGRRYWRDLVAAPAWFPPPTTPDRELVRRRPDGRRAADDDAVGPGYRSAYGLVAFFHHQAIAVSGGVQYADIEIRTHGSANYRSILRGNSHGCHRLFNHLALRLGAFVLAHAEHERRGLIDQRYSRTVHWKGRSYRLQAESRGYRYELEPPIPVDVLPGRTVRSKAAPQRLEPASPAAPQSAPNAPPTTPQT